MMVDLTMSLVLLLFTAAPLDADWSVNSRQDEPPVKVVHEDDSTKWPGLSEPQIQLANKLFEDHWKRVDRREQLRKAQPPLFHKHRELTGKWVAELESEQLEMLLKERPSGDETKQVRNLSSEFKNASEELFAHYQLASQLAFKVIQGHWQGMVRTGISRDQVPDYAAEFETCVIEWFHQRSIEDLRIFEKPKPKANERERGEKITADLMQQIKSVQEAHAIRDF